MKGFDMATSPDIYATTESRNKREDSPKNKPRPSLDSALLTPSEIESMKKDFQAGRFRDDLTFDDFLAEMQRERCKLDREESASWPSSFWTQIT